MLAARQVRAGNGARVLRLIRREMAQGRLGVVVAGHEGVAVVLADDVPDPDVAGAVRHLIEHHESSPGSVALCRAPFCPAWEEWRAAGCRKAASGQ